MTSATILVGDVRTRLSELDDRSVQTCVTSPPYYGKRNYDHPQQIGLESSVQEFIDTLVAVFREVHRVLRDDGTLWVNIGDSYGGSGRGSVGKTGFQHTNVGSMSGEVRRRQSSFPKKQLIGVPWRLAFALQDDGWILRSDIVWGKSNPTPESVTDRPTSSHEYVFLLAKCDRYYFDSDAIREPASDTGRVRGRDGRRHQQDLRALPPGSRPHRLARVDYSERDRNMRDVWHAATSAGEFRGAHFAVMPKIIAKPCVLAGAPEGGVVLDPFCGAGTTGLVALRYQREFVGIELNPHYAELAKRRIEEDQPLFNRVEIAA